MLLAVHGAPIDADVIVAARDVCERTRALVAIQRQRWSGHFYSPSLRWKGRGCRLSQWQLVKSLDRELDRTAVAPTDGDPFINRRNPHIGRLTQGAHDNGRHRRRIAGARSLDAQEIRKRLSGLSPGLRLGSGVATGPALVASGRWSERSRACSRSRYGRDRDGLRYRNPSARRGTSEAPRSGGR